uniref:Uncharacterized protein n=1 Tax=Helianthus annuus TaxID=4232 RepID=A0A251UFT1_HELAN
MSLLFALHITTRLRYVLSFTLLTCGVLSHSFGVTKKWLLISFNGDALDDC